MNILLEWTQQKATDSEKSWDIFSIKKSNIRQHSLNSNSLPE